MPMNSRSYMESVIRNKASVMLPDFRVITRLEDLPSEAELARMEAKVADQAVKEAEVEAKRLDERDPDAAAAVRATAAEIRAAATRRQEQATSTLRSQIDRHTADLEALKAPAPAPPVAAQSPPPPRPSATVPPGTAAVAAPPAAPKMVKVDSPRPEAK